MTMRTVSAAIRCVRVNPFLKQLLSSLEAQTEQPLEIVIVIPEDTTNFEQWRPVVEQCKLSVRLIKAPRGMVTQRAAGIAACRDLVLLLDDDLILPPNFIEQMLTTMENTGAQCVIPLICDGYPKSHAAQLWLSLFRIAVPYRGPGGNRLLLSGGFEYPRSALKYGEFSETEVGMGAAVLIDGDWALAHNATGDTRLQLEDNPYALRDDAALIYLQRIAGGRAYIVNAGDVVHLGGTTLLDSRRRMWTMDASVYNNFIFWERYVYLLQPTLFRRVLAVGGIALHLLGISALAILSTIRSRSACPVRGLVRGYARLLGRAFQ